MLLLKLLQSLQILRRRHRLTGFHAVLLCVGLLLLPVAHAAGRVALLIGNKNYTAQTVLENPIRDIELVAEPLRKLGFDVRLRSNLKRAEMIEAIDIFITDSAGADVALFYYAGHGMQPTDGGRNYLLPIDARRILNDSVLRADAIAANGPEGVMQRMEFAKNPAQLRLLLLDACRDNPKGRAGLRSVDRGLAPVRPSNEYTLVSYSTRESFPAKDDLNGSTHSPYATALSKVLPMAGYRTVRDLFDVVGDEVKDITKGEQTPVVYTSMPGRLMLTGAKRERTEEEIEEDAWFAANQANTAVALHTFIQEFQKSKYASQARVRLAIIEASSPPVPKPGQIIKDCDVCPELVVLPRGEFMMGALDNEDKHEKNETPRHLVKIDYNLAVSRYEITQKQWIAIMGDNPSKFKNCGLDCPVDSVSWHAVNVHHKVKSTGFSRSALAVYILQ
jgi:hypothetical protein